MKKILSNSLILLLALSLNLNAQKLPAQFHFSPDGKRLLIGNNENTGVYNTNEIKVIELIFDDPNYWTTLTNNYKTSTDLGATMIYNGDTLKAKVGVRFKGQTSYGGGPGGGSTTSQKKSFNISLDFEDEKLDIGGYKTFNLNNSYQDASFMREVLYLNQSKQNWAAMKANFVQLKLNGQDWGIYQNVQQLNSDYIKDWFMNNDGIRWRALRTSTTGGGPGGGGFGAGTSSLNYLGADTALYIPNYTLKSTGQLNPWTKLAKVCEKLNQTPLANLEDTIVNYMDLDRTLWFLATEIAFTDDDSYVWKGGMDYWIYWDAETQRLTPLEYDGNSAINSTAINWSPFYNETNVKFPLLNRLLAVPNIRQRYIAHMKTILNTAFDETSVNATIDKFAALIDENVKNDPKKTTTYQAFVSSKATLKSFFKSRKAYILNNAEFKATGVKINSLVIKEVPADMQTVNVTTTVADISATDAVYLYYGTGFSGKFQKVQMFDDGTHYDGAANDGIFGASIPGFAKGTYIRYYTEAKANNTAKTATFFPEGAEHDVFIYQVKQTVVASEVVINEIMASNKTTAKDQDDEYDDWVELYNNSNQEIDLSAWLLSDDATKLDKYALPAGTKIAANGYLIIWADENGKQNGLHANFKFSADGEACYLSKPTGEVVQEVTFGAQQTDKGFARMPNGTGNFVIQNPTFGTNNNAGVKVKDIEPTIAFDVFPNPNNGFFSVIADSAQNANLLIINSSGQQIYQSNFYQKADIDLSMQPSGIYFVKVGNLVKRIVKQ
jgi:hypothetical protein